MRNILDNILKPKEPPRSFGTIESRTGDGRYKILLDRGTTVSVDGDAGYMPGNKVIIQSGRIVGLGKRKSAAEKIRV